MPRATYVYCPTAKKVVPKEEAVYPEERRPHYTIIPPLEPFVSPVTGEVISSREQLRRHNKAHGVTNAADYSREWYEKKQQENYRKSIGDTPADRQDRINLLRRAIYRD